MKPGAYPNDADGEGLRRIAEAGSDMARPMLIDFDMALPDETAAKTVAQIAAERGFDARIDLDHVAERFTVVCSKRMLATHANVRSAQTELNAVFAPFGAVCQGWGSFGNAED